MHTYRRISLCQRKVRPVMAMAEIREIREISAGSACVDQPCFKRFQRRRVEKRTYSPNATPLLALASHYTAHTAAWNMKKKTKSCARLMENNTLPNSILCPASITSHMAHTTHGTHPVVVEVT